MVTQVTPFSTPLPDTFNQTAEEFEASANTLVSELNPRFTQMNSAILEMNELALNAETAAGELANTVWVSGTTYTAGQVRYSPVDFYSYRRKTNGAGTTDPSLDLTNWALQTKTTFGNSDTASSAVDVTLTSSSGRLQIISMTAADKKLNLPSATTLAKGAPLFVVNNKGLYRFSVHRSGGTFLCYVNPGQVLAFGCSDISTAAGVWSISGSDAEKIYSGNTAEVLNSVDSRFIAVSMLSATKAICGYKNNATGIAYAVILNYGSASGTPVIVNADSIRNISIAALSSSKAVMVYQQTANSNIKGCVLDVSGNSITPGTEKTIITIASASGANGTSLAVLSATKLLLAYMYGGASSISEKVLDISGSTIVDGTETVADASSFNVASTPYLVTKPMGSTKAIVVFLGSSFQTNIRLQSISGATPSPTGTVLSIPSPGVTPSAGTTFAVCAMNANRTVIIRSVDRKFGDIIAYLIDTSGTTPILVSSKNIPLSYKDDNLHLSAAKIDADKIYITFPGGYSLGADSLVLTVSSDDRMYVGNVSERLEPGITAAAGYVACDALDSSHVMQVCRNASTFLSAKTIEIS
ncbi:MAG: hypothetical protein K2Q13_04060 [Nitrosomonas sp.]|uniref:hypothetical protein n=1 Tax=Nitrosomonas sp. TaxID=42353 RepID=UPI0025DCA88C|nr:hypothetical protein [Nitrosomonas sp.]MBY0474222.1 hypothetical protein [Nitrosomonas sp.]